MNEYIALDVHKRYSLGEREEVRSGRAKQCRIKHERGAVVRYLCDAKPGTVVALEATGNWYWIVDEIEQAGMKPVLVNAHKAKLMFGCVNKTDKLDVHGLNVLQRVGTLPTVWIAPGEIGDLRDLPRTRMVLIQWRTRLKNRIGATLAKYGLEVGYSDKFGAGGRKELEGQLEFLPPQTRLVTEELLEQWDVVGMRIGEQERRMGQLVEQTPQIARLMTLPGVGKILGIVIALEIGDIRRFGRAEQLACYAGTVPRVRASGDRVRMGRLRADVNRYLKWAYIEAANSVCLHRASHPRRHVSRLYERVARKGHPKAIGAVARHLAEATFYMLTRQEDYCEPASRQKLCCGA
ncbi:MAG: IS110 family transposase [Deltaproteobacteria bacterium]|nr:IS110 family transposase [Deltaproteobacteria bacterium]